MPTTLGRLPAKCRGHQKIDGIYTFQVVASGGDLWDALLGDEPLGEDFEHGVNMGNSGEFHTTMLAAHERKSSLLRPPVKQHPKTGLLAVDRRARAVTRVAAAYKANLPVLDPRTKRIGDNFRGASPIYTGVKHFQKADLERGLHVLDMFGGITCGGLRAILEVGYHVKCYTSIEVDDTSRAIVRCIIDRLQTQYPGQLSDSAIRGYSKRVPQDIALVDETSLNSLVQINGPIHLICGGWECQSMNMGGMHKGMKDERFDYFLDMVKIVNYLQK